eukprot:6475329-Amphidinium_carterae.1
MLGRRQCCNTVSLCGCGIIAEPEELVPVDSDPVTSFELDPDFDYDHCKLTTPEFPYDQRCPRRYLPWREWHLKLLGSVLDCMGTPSVLQCAVKLHQSATESCSLQSKPLQSDQSCV